MKIKVFKDNIELSTHSLALNDGEVIGAITNNSHGGRDYYELGDINIFRYSEWKDQYGNEIYENQLVLWKGNNSHWQYRPEDRFWETSEWVLCLMRRMGNDFFLEQLAKGLSYNYLRESTTEELWGTKNRLEVRGLELYCPYEGGANFKEEELNVIGWDFKSKRKFWRHKVFYHNHKVKRIYKRFEKRQYNSHTKIFEATRTWPMNYLESG